MKHRQRGIVWFAMLLLLSSLTSIRAQQAPTATPAMQAADALFQAQKWAEAAQGYEAVTKTEATNARAWYRLGVSLCSLNKYEPALAAFQQALKLNETVRPQGALTMYALAATYARLNKKDEAFAWLQKSLAAKLPQPGRLDGDANFESLHGDPRYQVVLATALKLGHVCLSTPEYRQFDYWVGEWNVLAQGQQVGTSKVELLEDGCIVAENWTSGQGGQTGKSFNFYNPVAHKWHQSYMGNDAGNWMMDGEFKDSAMRLVGHIYTPSGEVATRMTFFNLGPDKVRQLGENSTDGGKTWTITWDAIYVRKSETKPAAAQ